MSSRYQRCMPTLFCASSFAKRNKTLATEVVPLRASPSCDFDHMVRSPDIFRDRRRILHSNQMWSRSHAKKLRSPASGALNSFKDLWIVLATRINMAARHFSLCPRRTELFPTAAGRQRCQPPACCFSRESHFMRRRKRAEQDRWSPSRRHRRDPAVKSRPVQW